MKLYNEPLLTCRDVANLLKVDTTTVRRWVNNGTVSAIHLPSKLKEEPYTSYRFNKNDMRKYLNPNVVLKEGEEARYIHSKSQYAVCEIKKLYADHAYVVFERETDIIRVDTKFLTPFF